MTTFIKKSFTVFLMALAFMFIVGDLVHVGDLNIDNSVIETSKNYNGYLPLELENKLISLGFVYGLYGYNDEYNYFVGVYGYLLDMTNAPSDLVYFSFPNMVVYDYDYQSTDYPYAMYVASHILIDATSYEIFITLMNDMHLIHFHDDYRWVIVGRSNYEVTP